MPDHQAPDLGQSPQLYHRHLTTGKQTLQIPSGCAFPQHMQRSTLPSNPPQPGHPSWSPASVNPRGEQLLHWKNSLQAACLCHMHCPPLPAQQLTLAIVPDLRKLARTSTRSRFTLLSTTRRFFSSADSSAACSWLLPLVMRPAYTCWQARSQAEQSAHQHNPP